MNFKNYAVIIGLQTIVTELTVQLCRELGIQLFYAMKKSNAIERITSLDDDFFILPSTDGLAESTFCDGMLVPGKMLNQQVDNISNEDRFIFNGPLQWYVHRIDSEMDIPTGWSTHDLNSDQFLAEMPVGMITESGRIIVQYDGVKKLLQIPEQYRPLYSIIKGIY
jgi:hypothetical protein